MHLCVHTPVCMHTCVSTPALTQNQVGGCRCVHACAWVCTHATLVHVSAPGLMQRVHAPLCIHASMCMCTHAPACRHTRSCPCAKHVRDVCACTSACTSLHAYMCIHAPVCRHGLMALVQNMCVTCMHAQVRAPLRMHAHTYASCAHVRAHALVQNVCDMRAHATVHA